MQPQDSVADNDAARLSAEDSQESREVSDGECENPKQGGYKLTL